MFLFFFEPRADLRRLLNEWVPRFLSKHYASYAQRFVVCDLSPDLEFASLEVSITKGQVNTAKRKKKINGNVNKKHEYQVIEVGLGASTWHRKVGKDLS